MFWRKKKSFESDLRRAERLFPTEESCLQAENTIRDSSDTDQLTGRLRFDLITAYLLIHHSEENSNKAQQHALWLIQNPLLTNIDWYFPGLAIKRSTTNNESETLSLWRQAIKRDPARNRAAARFYTSFGNDDGLEFSIEAAKLEPLSPDVISTLISHLNANGRHQEVLKTIAQLAEINWSESRYKSTLKILRVSPNSKLLRISHAVSSKLRRGNCNVSFNEVHYGLRAALAINDENTIKKWSKLLAVELDDIDDGFAPFTESLWTTLGEGYLRTSDIEGLSKAIGKLSRLPEDAVSGATRDLLAEMKTKLSQLNTGK